MPIETSSMKLMVSLPLKAAEGMDIGEEKDITLSLKLKRRTESDEYNIADFELLDVLQDDDEDDE